jgi:tetratricopeptide (TPR) repeat protein
MFFPRLRRQAKWAFALMILVFGVGFVLLGVGSGGLDLGSLLRDSFGRGGSAAPSIEKAQKKVDKNPRNATAQKELATAYEGKGRLTEAIATYQQYMALRPKDTDALAHLGSLQTAQADNYLQQAQLAFFAQSEANGRSIFGAAPTSKFGRGLGNDPIASAVQSKTGTAAQQANAQYQSAAQAAIATYKKIAKVDPSQDNLLLLAGKAQHFQDTTTAIKTYKQVLKRTDDPTLKASIRAQIKALQPSSAAGGGG